MSNVLCEKQRGDLLAFGIQVKKDGMEDSLHFKNISTLLPTLLHFPYGRIGLKILVDKIFFIGNLVHKLVWNSNN